MEMHANKVPVSYKVKTVCEHHPSCWWGAGRQHGHESIQRLTGWARLPGPWLGRKAWERRSIWNRKSQMQSVCAHMFFCGRISVFVYAGVSLIRSIKMPVIFSSLCLCMCVCWCSPLCSCDPWDSGWAVTLLICPSRNTSWKMSSEHSELCLH